MSSTLLPESGRTTCRNENHSATTFLACHLSHPLLGHVGKENSITDPSSTNVVHCEHKNVLIVNQPSHVPEIDFGSVIIGTSSVRLLRFRNPSSPQGSGHGAHLMLESPNAPKHLDQPEFHIEMHSCHISEGKEEICEIVWTPTTVGTQEHQFTFRCDNRIQLQCLVYGTAVKHPLKLSSSRRPKIISSMRKPFKSLNRANPSMTGLSSPKQRPVRKQQSLSSSVTNRSSRSTSHLIKKKESSTLIPNHGKVYDENWMKKQQRAITIWMNSVFTSETTQDPTPSTPAPIRALTQTRAEAKLRHAASQIFQNQDMQAIQYHLDLEIKETRLKIRHDRELHVDLGLQSAFIELLFCYKPEWLRLGLEIVTGVPIPRGGYKILKKFILEHWIKDREIYDVMGKSNKTLHGINLTTSLQERLHQSILKKFFLLVVFLDKARSTYQQNILPHVPCLFHPQSMLKSSQDIVKMFCTEYLSGEGDIIRHLHFIGIEVGHIQSPLDEFQLQVRNIATDLRDGVRLVKLVDMLSDGDLSLTLRVPATSRLQKIHNVNLVVSKLDTSTCGLRGGLNARDIVDGHCEKTLWLVWKVSLGHS